MASVKMIPEAEATEKVREIYAEIMDSLGIDFVPNMYKVMAHRPAFLEAQWKKTRAVMREPGKLDPLDQGDHCGRRFVRDGM